MIQLSIMSASTKRAECNAAKLEREIAHQRYLAERPKRVEKFVENYFNYAKGLVEKSESLYGVSAVIYESDLYEWGHVEEDEMMEAIETVKTLFEIAGYKVNNWYTYSSGWRYQSGKIGYLHINWDKIGA